MDAVLYFFLAFIFSFVGSIPPGSINLTLVKLGLENKTRAAFKFAIAASLVEYPYAWIAVRFEKLILSSPAINSNIHLFASVVMLVLGVINLLPSNRSKDQQTNLNDTQKGFRRGLLIGILNPMAIPFWIAITAYLRSEGLIVELSGVRLQSYLIGVVLGAISLLYIVIFMSGKARLQYQNADRLKKIPGFILVILGLFSLFRYAASNF